jgi:8-oxo-dGTP pyrophosphatase MutT (NUDIX family)
MKNPAAEIVQIVDRHNRVTGECPRFVMRQENRIHRASYILVFNHRRELFVQRRSMEKDIYPGYWDIAAGGVVLANESYQIAANRELFEELGVSGVTLVYLFDHYYEDSDNRVWGRIFTCTHEGPFTLQTEEITDGRFMTVVDALMLNTTEPFTPDSVELLHKIKL